MRLYSGEVETYALHVEVFHAGASELQWEGQEEPSGAGWYFWSCFPGCLPDSDPIGPYASEEAAASAAREWYE